MVGQKYEKPKFIQCLAFLNNGDILTGDSGGVLLVWTRSAAETSAKGPRGEGPEGAACCADVPSNKPKFLLTFDKKKPRMERTKRKVVPLCFSICFVSAEARQAFDT